MNDVTQQDRRHQHQRSSSISATFNASPRKVLNDLGELATQFNTHGRSLGRGGRAARTQQPHDRRTASRERQTSIETLVSHARREHRRSRAAAARFSSLLDELLEAADDAGARDRRMIAETSNDERARPSSSSSSWCARLRGGAQAHQRNAQRGLRSGHRRGAGDVQPGRRALRRDRAGHEADGRPKCSSELEATRAELRRGILELPQETAESAAQMRRVIVDQIEALAELNRIVARHGRSLDTAEPARREAAPSRHGGGRAQRAPRHAAARRSRPLPRADLGPPPPRPRARHHRRAEPRRSEPPPAAATACRSARTAATAATAAGSAIS